MSFGEFESSTCPICAEIYSNPSRRPVLLANCGHSLCEKCLTKMKSRIGFKTVLCPICREYVTSAPVNYQLMKEAQRMRSEFTRNYDTRTEEKVKKVPTTSEETQVSDRRTISFYGFPTHLKMEELYSFFDSIAKVEIDSDGPAVHLDQWNDNGQGAGTVVFESNIGADRAIRTLHQTVYPGTKNRMIMKHAAVQNIRAKAAEYSRSRPVPSAPPMSEAPEEVQHPTTRQPGNSPQPPPSPFSGSGAARSTQHNRQPSQRRENREKGGWMNQCFIAGGSLLTCWITLGIVGYTASHLSRGGKLYTI